LRNDFEPVHGQIDVAAGDVAEKRVEVALLKRDRPAQLTPSLSVEVRVEQLIEIVAAAARTYRQARRRGRRAFENDDPAALHAFRARVVDLRYQLALLACAWPEALKAQAEGLNELRESLGDHHDLHVLAAFAAELGSAGPAALAQLQERVEAKQEMLGRRAETEYRRLFAETPRAFASRLAAYLGWPVKMPAAELP